MAQKPTAFLQVRKFPRKVLDRIDAAAKLLGIKREEIVIEVLQDATRDVKELRRQAARRARKTACSCQGRTNRLKEAEAGIAPDELCRRHAVVTKKW